MSEFINTRDEIGEQATLDGLVAHTLTELNDDTVTSLGQYALYNNTGLESVSLPSVTSVGSSALNRCTNLEDASFDKLETLGDSAFFSCLKLNSVYLPALTNIGNNAFQNCEGLETISLPAVTFVGQYAFADCKNLRTVSLPLATNIRDYAFEGVPVLKLVLPKVTILGSTICSGNGPAELDFSEKVALGTNTFYNSQNLTSLILRNSQQSIMSNTLSLSNTPIAKGFGWIYVPDNLVSTYKMASNWGAFANRIVSLNDYPKTITGSITDTWAEIFDAEDDGTYSTKYHVGDTKILNINDSFVVVQIVAIDGDELSDNTGNAKITWMCIGLTFKHSMNATATGGWASSGMRQYLIDEILPNIDSEVKAKIKSVKKTYYSEYSTLVSNDSIWIPSYREVGLGTNKENSGVIYSGLFTDNNHRVKGGGAFGAGTSSGWWLRSWNNNSTFHYVTTSGSSSYSTAANQNGVVFGFCT